MMEEDLAMQLEIGFASDFLAKFLTVLPQDQVERFRQSLQFHMNKRFEGHWFPDKPMRGQAYRCMRIVNRRFDDLLAQAGMVAGISEAEMARLMPKELTVWVDPDEVSYRFGEEGSVGVIYEHKRSSSPVSVSSSPSSSASSGSSTPVSVRASSPESMRGGSPPMFCEGSPIPSLRQNPMRFGIANWIEVQ